MKHSRFYQTVVAIAMILMGWLPSLAHDFEVDGICYNILSDNSVEVTYNGSSYNNDYEDVIIPETVTHDGSTYSVTSIGESAFYDSKLTSIKIPNSVIGIGYRAFYDCTSLTNIEIPNSVTSIENHAFFYCTSLANITIPNSVTSIKYNAFYNCSSLTSIEIPNSVTNIESSAFSYCTSLTSVKIPNSMTDIRMHTFAYCSSLTSIEIPNSVTNIEYSAFYSCYNLTKITCLATIPPTIYYDTFSNYYADLYVPAGCKTVYEAANYWKNFNIIEDLNAIETVADEHEAEYFNLQGLPVANPEKGGLYIIKRGNKIGKSIIR